MSSASVSHPPGRSPGQYRRPGSAIEWISKAPLGGRSRLPKRHGVAPLRQLLTLAHLQEHDVQALAPPSTVSPVPFIERASGLAMKA